MIGGFIQDQLGELASNVTRTVTIAVLSTFLTFFFLLDADHGAEWALRGVPYEDRAPLRDRGRDAALRIGGFVRAIAAASVVRSAAMLVVMVVLGTPFAGPLAVVLLVGGLIPYLGVLVSTVAIVLVALGQGLGPAVLVVAAAIGIEVALTVGRSRVEGSHALRVHPAIALIALPIGAVAAGVIGMIVAVPVAAFLQLMTGTALAAFQPRLPRMSSTGTVVPGWLDRLAHWSRGLLVGVGLLGGLLVIAIQLSAPVLAVVLGAVLAATLAPAASALRRRGAGPTAAAFGATVGLVAGISRHPDPDDRLARQRRQPDRRIGRRGLFERRRGRARLARVAHGPGVNGLRRGARCRDRLCRDLAGPGPGPDPGGDPDVLLPARRRGRLALGDREARGLAAA